MTVENREEDEPLAPRGLFQRANPALTSVTTCETSRIVSDPAVGVEGPRSYFPPHQSHNLCPCALAPQSPYRISRIPFE